ncbi:MAG: GAF domain-containing SpoIIE family protein phosphatase [Ignavibacteriaceae bacterium]
MTESIVKLQEENKRLRTAIEELSVINEISTAISSTQPQEEIIDLIVNKCVKHLKVEQGAVMLLKEKDVDKPFHTIMRKQDSVTNYLPYHFDAQLTGWMLKNKSPLLINDFENDTRFKFIVNDKFPIHSLLSVPMNVKGKMIGLLSVFNKKTESEFNNNDLRLLGIISAQSAQVIESARLYQEEQSLICLQEDMRLAYEIQTDLLPKEQPKILRFEIAGKSIPAKDVGGDYFDFIQIDENRLAFCLADISGKGIPAAILMANLQASLRGQAKLGRTCKESVAFTNDILFHNTSPSKYATLFYGILNDKTNEITYCNAGHNTPFLFSGEENPKYDLTKGGLAVGIIPSFPFEESILTILPNDLLILFSDGITEAMNSDEEEFGEERLKEIILKNINEIPEKLIEIILSEVQKFAMNTPQMDDMTIVIIKRKS